jgi:hypothetical protein
MDELLYQTYEFCGLSMDLIFDPNEKLVPKFLVFVLE